MTPTLQLALTGFENLTVSLTNVVFDLFRQNKNFITTMQRGFKV